MTSFKAMVERSSLGSRNVQAARKTVSTKTAATVVGKSMGTSSSKTISKKSGGK